eukprot:CAMPEP_0206197558 /NCGR_PEP_ID=MMETSP0166-20121206/9121_1 /ASSEMBLY_ACC=CAM_ASM_000260 /TAXON_ID=95228 /ORGANISM="Vannella robusta, Strain DIVA3 518/3/11/1/6" /LENGTH=1037 /DNA_ID=CAMNT_0053615259 /DNA_START=260 /DNA_END=3371 /DNA_ORIENTATION=-
MAWELQHDDSKYLPATGTEGVFIRTSLTPFSIGYVSYSFIQNSLSDDFYVRLINKFGTTVKCTGMSIRAATKGVALSERLTADITDSSEEFAWPLATFTYIIARRESTKPELCEEFWRGIGFLDYALTYRIAERLVPLNGFALISDEIVVQVRSLFEDFECDGEKRYFVDDSVKIASEPPAYYYHSLSPFSTIQEASYSPFYDSIGSSIPASEANQYEPSPISSLFNSNIVFNRYYEIINRSSTSTGTRTQPKQNVTFLVATTLHCFLFLFRKSNRMLAVLMLSCVLLSGTLAQSELRVAGFYPLSGKLSEFGPSCESASRVAIDVLNNQTIVEFDVITNFESFDTSSTASQGLQALTAAREEFNMFGIIGCHDDVTSSSVALSSGLFFFPQISYGSRGNFLSSSDDYPFFARVIPPFASEGIAISDLIMNYGWENVAVIFTADDYGTGTTAAFRSNLSDDMKVTIAQFTPGDTSLDPQMEVLRNSLARIIVMLPGSVEDARTILKEAYRYHMIGDDFIWFGGSFVSESNLFYNSTSEETDKLVKGISKGLIATKLKGAYGEPYENFLDLWETLNPLQFSGAGKRSIPLFAPYAYDATELFIRTFLTGDFISLDEFITVMANASFTGLTGPIQLNDNSDRLGIFDIVNLRDTNEGDKGWVRVGTWFEAQRDSSLRGFEFDYKIRFHSGSTQVPDVEVRPAVEYWSCSDHEMKVDETGKIRLDTPGPDAENLADFYHCDTFIDCENFSDESSDGCISNYLVLFIVFGVLTGICVLITVLFIPFVILFGIIMPRMRIRTASTVFLLIILCSIIVGFISIFAWFGQAHKVSCAFQPWLLGLSVNSMIAALFAKNTRIYRIFRSPLKRKAIPDSQVVAVWLIMILPAIFILGLWTLISTPTAILKERGDEQHWVCETGGFTGPPGGLIFFIIFVSYSGLMLLAGAIISFLARKVPSMFNESQLIAISIYNLVILSVIIIPIFFVLQDFNPFVGWIIRSIAILYGFFATLCLLFVPKIWGLLKDGGFDPSSFVTGSPKPESS